MAGNIKVGSVQLGDSATATQNFTLRTNVDGTATLARGNVGATTQDILTIGVDGTVKLPASLTPAFSAYLAANQSISSSVFTKVAINTELFDTATAFDSTTNYRFQPLIAGYYQFNAAVAATTSTGGGRLLIEFWKNGSAISRGTDIAATQAVSHADLIYMNGTTDYLELYAYIVATTAVIDGTSRYTHFSGCLVART